MLGRTRLVVFVLLLMGSAMGDHHHTHGRTGSSEDKQDQILLHTQSLKESVLKNQQILEANKDALSKAHEQTNELLKSIGELKQKKDGLPQIEDAIRSLHETTQASHEVVSQHKTETAAMQQQVKQIRDSVEKTQSSLAQLQQEISKLKEGFQRLQDSDQKRKPQDYSEILNQLLANQAVLLNRLNSTSTLDSLWQFTRSFLSGVKRTALQAWSQVSQVVSEALISGKGMADFYGNQGFKGFTDVVPKLRRLGEDGVDLIKMTQKDLKAFFSSHGPAVAQHADTIAWVVLGLFSLFAAVILLVILGRLCRCLCCCCCRRKGGAERSNAPAGERSGAGKKGGKKGGEAKPASH